MTRSGRRPGTSSRSGRRWFLEHQIGLTELYNRVDDGAFDALRQAHRRLDLAVVAAYGWEPTVVDDVAERNRRLFDLNAAINAGRTAYEPF